VAFASWILVRQFDPSVSFVDVLTVTPVIFILFIIPISIAGWGCAKDCFVAGLGLIGVSHDAALIRQYCWGWPVWQRTSSEALFGSLTTLGRNGSRS
jgi:hypothetical protein